MRRLGFVAALVALSATGAGAQVVYSNNFNGGSTANLTATGGGVATHAAFAGCSSGTYCSAFLGRANGNPLDNETATLSLAGLPGHTGATVSFSLFVLNSWDGNGSSGFGPDLFTVAADAATLLNTTFGIALGPQNYPDDYNVGTHPVRTGAVENNSLGDVGSYGSSVYELSFTFAHSAPTLAVDLTGSGLQGWGDEGWGIDNLQVSLIGVTATPEPSTYALLGTGLLALGGLARRRRA